MKELLKKNFWFYGLLMLYITGFGIYLLIHGKGDFSILLNSFHTPALDIFFRYTTWLGDGITISVICVLFTLIRFRYAVISGIISFTSALIINLLKNLFNFPRPSVYFEGRDLNFLNDFELYSWHSFPSGHTAAAFAMFCTLGFFVKNSKWGILFFLFAFLVALSRVYLFQHFLEDVYFGALIGTFNATILYYLLDRSKWLNKNWSSKSLIRLSGN